MPLGCMGTAGTANGLVPEFPYFCIDNCKYNIYNNCGKDLYMRYIDISEDAALHILSKHNVTIEEVFEVFFNTEEAPRIRRSPHGGKRYLAQGRTEAGRYLTIAFERKNHESIEIVTARDMQGHERRWYKEK